MCNYIIILLFRTRLNAVITETLPYYNNNIPFVKSTDCEKNENIIL